jgi:hypothetical protein
MTYHYLASPYSHPNADTRERRLDAAMDATAFLLKQKLWTYSPIVHCHQLAVLHNLPTSYDFWKPYNIAMLNSAHTLLVLTIEGWDTSAGVADEIDYAHRLKLPTKFIHAHNSTYIIRRAA